MPYVPRQKAESRKRIIESAVASFGQHGFDNVTIDDVMKNAGMTRGGFYKHFRSKDALFVEAILTGVVEDAAEHWPGDLSESNLVFDRLVYSYLDSAHLDRPDACPLIRFPESAATGDEQLRDAYTTVAKSIAAAFDQALPQPDSDQTALATLALCVGGMVIARTVNDSKFAADLRNACANVAIQIAARPEHFPVIAGEGKRVPNRPWPSGT